MRSARLRQLERRYKELRKQFLPKNFSKTGNYSVSQYSAAAAFRLLFHSEMESYLENFALDTLNEIEASVVGGVASRGGSAVLCLYKADGMGGIPTQVSEIDPKPFLTRTQLKCIYELRRRIDANRGVKSHNLLSMFVPLGVSEPSVEEQFLIDLNTLGARRGDVAHKGLNAITSLPDPKEEKLLAERIIRSLATFEELLSLVTP